MKDYEWTPQEKREYDFISEWQDRHDSNPTYADAIAWADTHPNWIKVEDRLPGRDGGHHWTKNVLVHCPGPSDYDDEPNVTIAFYNHCKKQWYDLADNSIEVTHWMPLIGPKED